MRRNDLIRGFAPARPAAELWRVLQEVSGLTLHDGHRGSLRVGRRRASVCLESMECIRVVLGLDPTAPVGWEVQQELPGNLRIARSAAELYAVADLHTSPEHLPGCLAAVGHGLARITRRQPPRPRPATRPEPAIVQAAVEGMGWAEGEVVAREEAWELRPRIGGRAAAVQMRAADRGLHLYRPVLSPLPESAAVTDQALRCNARLRWARLGIGEHGIVAETCLPAALISPAHLAAAARAVAAAAHHTAIPLAVLAHNGQVAGRYLDLFIKPKQGAKS